MSPPPQSIAERAEAAEARGVTPVAWRRDQRTPGAPFRKTEGRRSTCKCNLELEVNLIALGTKTFESLLWRLQQKPALLEKKG